MQHKGGHTRTTNIFETFELVYSEEYSTIAEARKREKKLASYKSKRYIEWFIKNNRVHSSTGRATPF